MKNIFVKKIIYGSVVLLLLVYVGYQVYLHNSSNVKVEAAVQMTVCKSVGSTGFIVRKENIISKEINGVLSYNIQDSEKVSKNGLIAKVYRNKEDATIHKEIQNIDDEIKKLKQLNNTGKSSSINPDTINTKILQSIRSFIFNNNNGSYLDMYENHNNITYLINERQIILGAVENFDGRISELELKKKTINGQGIKSIGEVNAPLAGYFVRVIDGFENTFDYSNISFISPEQVKNVLNKGKEDIQPSQIGKIISDLDWYVICLINSNDAVNFKVNGNVDINFPFTSTQSFPCKVVAVNQPDKESEAAVILTCNYMSKNLCLIRNESVKIDFEKYNGIMINKNSVHESVVKKVTQKEDGTDLTEEKKVKGVYVKYGNKLVFKEIRPIYSEESYIICDMNPGKDKIFTESTIQLYDEVVVGGTDLYDGKIIK